MCENYIRRHHSSSLAFSATSNTLITDAYLVSVDKEHIKEVTKRLKKEYPELRTFDMESIAAASSSASTEGIERASGRRPEAIEMQERITNRAQRQKENDFLRTSMRQSKKMQALTSSIEKSPPKEGKTTSFANPLTEVAAFDNECFDPNISTDGKPEMSSKDHSLVSTSNDGTTRIAVGDDEAPYVNTNHKITDSDNENNNEAIELKQVIVSVDRIAKRLSTIEGREQDVEMLRNFFGAPPIQAAIEQTAAALSNTSAEGMTTRLNGSTAATSSGIGSDTSRTSTGSAASVQDPLTHLRPSSQLLPSSSTSSTVSATQDIGNGERRAVRVVSLFKDEDSYLGATVRNEDNRVVVGRVVKGGIVERMGLFQEGDELLELNGVDLRGKQVGEICELLRNLKGEVNFVVAAPVTDDGEEVKKRQIQQNVQHLRALFDYDPEDDVYVPCKELAMKFHRGDVLHVLNTSDENWWQAYREGDDTQNQLAGLIPSSSFRQQVVMYADEVERENEKKKDSRKKWFSLFTFGLCAPSYSNSAHNVLLDSKKCKGTKDEIRKSADEEALPSIGVYSDMLTYEEVIRHLARADRKRPLVLCGAEGVGCLKLRDRLLESDRQKLACPVPYTSRQPKDGEIDGIHYHFTTKQKFHEEAKAGKFFEFGEYQKHWYGTSKADVVAVIHKGKTCVLTLKPESLGAIRCAEVKPLIVFVAAPSLQVLRRQRQCDGQFGAKDEELKAILAQSKVIEQMYGHLFDSFIVNTDFEKTFTELQTLMKRFETEPQWIPASWTSNQ